MSNARDLAPGVSRTVRRAAALVLQPLERFLHVEAASGVALLAAAAVALAWANSPWGASYDDLWNTRVALGIGGQAYAAPLHFMVNDALMTVFFLVVGLEIRREIDSGELSNLRRASLPIAAALGGMLVPALIYWGLARGTVVERGWAVPMATDIAFAVSVLALLGPRISPAVRVLLLALAIIDDIGAIAVIAVLFSGGIAPGGVLIVLAGVGAVVGFQRAGVRRAWLYVAPGAVVWFGFLRAGIHPSIAGVVLGLMTPVRSWFGELGFVDSAQRALEQFTDQAARPEHRPEDLRGALASIGVARREALAPVVRVQQALHGWVAFGIMPLFALANAGVRVAGLELTSASMHVAATGIVIGLFFGKPIGIVCGSFLAVRSGLCRLPAGVTWRSVAVVGAVGGVGFTMAIFMAQLALADPGVLGGAKLAVLAGSALSGVGGLLIGRLALPPKCSPLAAPTADLAEVSTEQ